MTSEWAWQASRPPGIDPATSWSPAVFCPRHAVVSRQTTDNPDSLIRVGSNHAHAFSCPTTLRIFAGRFWSTPSARLRHKLNKLQLIMTSKSACTHKFQIGSVLCFRLTARKAINFGKHGGLRRHIQTIANRPRDLSCMGGQCWVVRS